jgi:hypothetical protein
LIVKDKREIDEYAVMIERFAIRFATIKRQFGSEERERGLMAEGTVKRRGDEAISSVDVDRIQ